MTLANLGTLVENSRMTYMSIIFVLLPVIVVGLGYVGVPERVKNKFRRRDRK